MAKIYQKSLPSEKNAGFTLIELLVVVLIMGILAAVALPQYEKAVEKSRGAQALSVLHSFMQAYQAYYLANGVYPSSFDQLDIDMKGWTGRERWNASAPEVRSNGEWSLQLLLAHDTTTLYMGRLKGPYKGGGFGYLVANVYGIDNGVILCLERTGNGVVFTKNPGDYCEKLFRASPDAIGSGVRSYHMP